MITSVHLVTNQFEYVYLKRSLLGLGLKQDGSRFFNDNVTITYAIENISATKLKKIGIELSNAFE